MINIKMLALRGQEEDGNTFPYMSPLHLHTFCISTSCLSVLYQYLIKRRVRFFSMKPLTCQLSWSEKHWCVGWML